MLGNVEARFQIFKKEIFVISDKNTTNKIWGLFRRDFSGIVFVSLTQSLNKRHGGMSTWKTRPTGVVARQTGSRWGQRSVCRHLPVVEVFCFLLFEGKNAPLYWEYNQNSVHYITPWKLASLALMCLLAGFALAYPASCVAPSPSEFLIKLWPRFQLTSQVQKGRAPFQSVFSFTFTEWKGNEGVAAIFTEVNVQKR